MSSIFSEFCTTSHLWEATTAKRMKIDPHCQRQNGCTESTFKRCLDYIDNAGSSSARSLQSKYSERK